MNSNPKKDYPRPRTRQEATRRLTELLLERNLISREALEAIEHRALWLPESLDLQLLQDGGIPADTVRDLLSEITGMPTVSLIHTEIEQEALERLPAIMVVRYRVLPLEITTNSLTLACDHLVEPQDEEQIRILSGLSLKWRLCTARELDESVKHYYGVGLSSFIAPAEGRSAAPATEGDLQPDITGFVNEVLRDAIVSHATDIHFEPYEDYLRLRYRIDGVLYEIPLPRGAFAQRRAISTCIKVMAQLNIADKRLPQDGRFTPREVAGDYDIRVSVLPTRFGEAINLRILNHRGEFLRHQDLGLAGVQRNQLLDMIGQPHGIVLFTGPTGSGKTTSLYASLEYLNREERKIVTLEDPVEYQMKGVVQLQVHPEIGFTFPTGLRSILRHDPDVVLIGEIRDEETARIAISAALTGHLVLSTLHTNDSVSAATRLMDMGMEPYLLASSLQGIIAQRLPRRICPDCKIKDQEIFSAADEIRQHFPEISDKPLFYAGRGCPYCRFMGYRGRIGIFELLAMQDDLRKLIISRAPSESLLQAATRQGFVTLRHNAWKAALDGQTTVSEVLRLTRRDPLPADG